MLGIIGAMQMEIAALRDRMEILDTETVSGMEFLRGTLNGKDVVAVVSKEGKVASAVCAQTLILRYHVDAVINTGVAGTLCDGLGIKDVAIARDVVQHDMDVTARGYPLGQVPSLDVRKIPCDEALVKTLERAVARVGAGRARTGTIASGDVFLHTPEQKRLIVEQFDAIAGEMEGASIGHACYLSGVPFVVLRTISDDASGAAPVSFDAFAAEAAELACDIVTAFVDLLEERPRECMTIASFTVDHDRLEPGLYVSRRDGDVTTYDLRTRKPNQGDYMDNLTMHSVEHMFATYIRNSEEGEHVVYFGPMGCQTGFYLLTRDLSDARVLALVRQTLRRIIDHEGPVFGAERKGCGNYRNLNLEAAQLECRRYLAALDARPVTFAYD